MTDSKFRSTPAYVQMLEGERHILLKAFRQLRAAGEAKQLDPELCSAIERMEAGQRFGQSTHIETPWSSSPENLESGAQQQQDRPAISPNQQLLTNIIPTNHPILAPDVSNIDSLLDPQFSRLDDAGATSSDFSMLDYTYDEWCSFVHTSPGPTAPVGQPQCSSA